MQYGTHIPPLLSQDEENSWAIMTGTFLVTLHGHVLCDNYHLCGVCWEDCKRKKFHIPIPPEVVTAIAILLKTTQGGWHKSL